MWSSEVNLALVLKLCFREHIPFFRQVFQSGKLMVLPFGVLASEYNVEAKNISCFAGECRELFAKISKGGPH